MNLSSHTHAFTVFLPGLLICNLLYRLLPSFKLAFHDQWYEASRMTLCVLGNQPLDELEKIVVTGRRQLRLKSSSSALSKSSDDESENNVGEGLGDNGSSTTGWFSRIRNKNDDKQAEEGSTSAAESTTNNLDHKLMHTRSDSPTFSYDNGRSPFDKSSTGDIDVGDDGGIGGVLRRVAPVAEIRSLELTFPMIGLINAETKPYR